MGKGNPTKRPAANGDRQTKVHASTGNVFADLALPDPEEHLAKARLAGKICDLITAAGLTQKQAAMRLGVDQPKVSALARGRLNDFSTERLMRFVTALDHDVVITVREPKDADHPRVLVEV